MTKFSSPFLAKSPLNRRDKSKKENRLSDKLDTAKGQEQDAWEKADGGKKSERKQDRKERKVVRVEQKLDRESKKQSRKSLGLKGSGSDRKGDREERKDLKTKQERQAKRRKERENKK